jgi:hypothetical protein
VVTTSEGTFLTLAEANQIKSDFMQLVNGYAKEQRCSFSVALCEVSRKHPRLWREYSEAVTARPKEEVACIGYRGMR